MTRLYILASITIGIFAFSSCKKKGCTDPTATNYNSKAKKNDGSCTYGPTYTVPATYAFTNSTGQSTVDYSGQTDRINQLIEMIAYADLGETQVISAQVLRDMFANTNGNGNGNFSFTSTRDLKSKCFYLDTASIINWFVANANASVSFAQTASNGQAGTLTSGTNTYLFDANGFQPSEMIEKAIMGACFKYQALNTYLGSTSMSLDNTTPVAGQTYTAMEHAWDEAFGYLAVPTDYPTSSEIGFWGEYCASMDATLNSNAVMMGNFKKGRAAISNNVLVDRDAAIVAIRTMWENIAAYQAMRYLDLAALNFGVDQAKCLHVLSEAYGFINALRYAPLETRRMNQTEIDAVLAQFNGNLWTLSLADINGIKAAIDAKY